MRRAQQQLLGECREGGRCHTWPVALVSKQTASFSHLMFLLTSPPDEAAESHRLLSTARAEYCARGSLTDVLREAAADPEKAARLTWQVGLMELPCCAAWNSWHIMPAAVYLIWRCLASFSIQPNGVLSN